MCGVCECVISSLSRSFPIAIIYILLHFVLCPHHLSVCVQHKAKQRRTLCEAFENERTRAHQRDRWASLKCHYTVWHFRHRRWQTPPCGWINTGEGERDSLSHSGIRTYCVCVGIFELWYAFCRINNYSCAGLKEDKAWHCSCTSPPIDTLTHTNSMIACLCQSTVYAVSRICSLGSVLNSIFHIITFDTKAKGKIFHQFIAFCPSVDWFGPIQTRHTHKRPRRTLGEKWK